MARDRVMAREQLCVPCRAGGRFWRVPGDAGAVVGLWPRWGVAVAAAQAMFGDLFIISEV